MSEITKSEIKEIRKISLAVAVPVAIVILAIGIGAYHMAVHKKEDNADEEEQNKEK